MFTVSAQLPLKTENAGLFVSRGQGTHPTRTISSFELIFVRCGTLRMFEGKQSFVLPENSYLILYPGRLHGGAGDYPPDLSFYWIHFVMGTACSARTKHGVRLVMPQTGIVQRPERLVELYRQFLADQESGEQNQARGSLQMFSMLELLASAKKGRPASAVPPLITRAECLLTQEGHTGIRTGEIARRLHCNPDYLGRLYKRHVGLTLTEAILRRRMNEAQRRLLDGTENIGEIARSCGFGELKYFRKLFKKAKGITPSAYRRQYTRVHYNTA